jgi:HipA-like protein
MRLFGYKYSSPPPTLHVLYQGSDIAELKEEKGQYVFRYLEAFKRLGLAPLPGLADVDPSRTYKSSDLPRFFLERIPDTRRPEIREYMRRSDISEHDKLALLAELSRLSVTDPFELVLQAAA